MGRTMMLMILTMAMVNTTMMLRIMMIEMTIMTIGTREYKTMFFAKSYEYCK